MKLHWQEPLNYFLSRDKKNEAEFIQKRNEKQKQTKPRLAVVPSNVIYVDFVNKKRI
jgi:hypothetical protein